MSSAISPVSFNFNDFACALVAGDEWQPARGRIKARPEIGIDKIDAAGVVLDANLACPRSRNSHILKGQNLRPAVFVYAYCRNHEPLLLWVCASCNLMLF